MFVIFSKVEGLGGPVCKGSRCHWNRPCELLPVLVENLTAVFIETWSLDIPVLSRGRDFDWHIVGGYCTTGSLGVCGGIVENKDVVVIGIMPCQNIHGLGDLGDHVVMCKIAIMTHPVGS